MKNPWFLEEKGHATESPARLLSAALLLEGRGLWFGEQPLLEPWRGGECRAGVKWEEKRETSEKERSANSGLVQWARIILLGLNGLGT